MPKFRKTYNFSVSDSQRGEKLFSVKVSSRALIAALAGAVLLTMVLTFLLIDFTPLRRTVRGYPSRESREAVISNRLKIDSLERQISQWAFMVGNIQRVMSGREPLDLDSIARLGGGSGDVDIYAAMYARQDSLLRGIVEKEAALEVNPAEGRIEQIEGLNFFTPIKGMVTESFNLAINHPYITVAAEENATVYSILDGTVISAGWSEEDGYVIIVQHRHNLVSVFKHNERLLKKAGDKIKVGTPIAIAGSTGALATGLYLHFELWHAGEAVDPAQYISF